MARQIYSFSVTVPANTPAATPQRSPLTIPTRTVDEVEILVPPGPKGQVGFALGVSGTPVIPYNAGAWIVTDNERIRWPLEDYPDSGAWTLLAYNAGAFGHTLQVRFLCSLVAAGPPPLPAPLDASRLAGAVDIPVPDLSVVSP